MACWPLWGHPHCGSRGSTAGILGCSSTDGPSHWCSGGLAQDAGTTDTAPGTPTEWHVLLAPAHITPNCQGGTLPATTRTLLPPPAAMVKVAKGLPQWATQVRGAGRGRESPAQTQPLGGVAGGSKSTSCPGSIRLNPDFTRFLQARSHFSST